MIAANSNRTGDSNATVENSNDSQVDVSSPPASTVISNASLVQYGDRYSRCVTNVFHCHPLQSDLPNTLNYHDKNNVPDASPELKRKLKEMYSNAALPRVAWMEEGCDLLFEDYYAKLQLDSNGETIHIENIFEENALDNTTEKIDGKEAKSLKRILIEGQPGFGKTTLAMKLAFDWAVGARYMEKFELVLAIQLKEIVNDSVKTGIAKIAQQCSFNDEDALQDAILRNGNKVLILLDGFDELPNGKTRESVLSVLYQKSYNDAIVAVTCRNGMFQVENNDLKPFSIAFSRRKEFWDKKVSVNGVDENGTLKLLMKFLSVAQAREVILKLESLTEPLSGIFKCPLILILLGFLYARNMIVEIQTTKTTLYRAIVNGLAKYNVARQNGIVDENFDLFDNRLNSNHLSKEHLQKFGKCCLLLILDSNFQFKNCDFIQRVYSVGFLTKTESKSPFTTTYHFEAIHRSFIEFFAAFYIWQQFTNCIEFEVLDNKLLTEKLIQNLNDIFFVTQGTSLILPFLVGMMGSDVHQLFNKLATHSHNYSRIQNGLWRILEECQQTEEVTKALMPFIPRAIHPFGEKALSVFVSSKFFECLMKEQSTLQILTLHTNMKEVFKCPPNFHLRRIELYITSESLNQQVFKKYSSYLSQISCTEIRLLVIGEIRNSKSNQIEMTNWLKQFANIKTKKRILHILETTTCDLLLSCLKSGILDDANFIIQCISCDLKTDDCDWLDFFLFFMERNQVEELRLEIKDELCWRKLNDILYFASKSQCLSSLALYGSAHAQCSRYAIDLQSLANNGTKKWDSLNLYGMKLISTVPTTMEFHVNQLNFFTADESVARTLLNSHISMMHCYSSFLSNVADINGSFSNLTELIILLNDKYLEPEFWTNFTKLSEIKKLVISFGSESSFPENMVQSLNSMKINHLEVWCKSSSFNTSVLFIQELVKSITQNQFEGNVSIQSINIFLFAKHDDLSELVVPLLECLEKEILELVGIIWMKIEDCNSESLNWVDETKFRIKVGVAGMEEDEMKYWRSEYNSGIIYQKIDIQLHYIDECETLGK